MSSRALVRAAALSALQEQVLRTVPGAKDAPLPVILGACALAYTLDLNIAAGEVYIASFGSAKAQDGRWEKQYTYGVGIKGARILADREARWQVTFRLLPPAEAAALRGELYDPGDIGVEASITRYDDAMAASRAGVQYQPRSAVGWYRVKARYNAAEKKWVPDQIPNTWTARDVAEKRAEMTALKRAFSWGTRPGVRLLDPAGDNAMYDNDSGGLSAAVVVADRLIDEQARRLPPPPGGEIDENGYITATVDETARKSAISADAVARAIAAPDRDETAAPLLELPPEVAAWRSPEDAYEWAVGIGASDNVFAARNAMKNIVDAHGGRFTKETAATIYVAYYHDRMARAQEKAKGAA